MPEVVGANVTDQSGNEHLGIIEFPVPILKGSPEIIKAIREKLYQPDFQDLTVVDFTDLAQGCKTYDEFISKMGTCQKALCNTSVLPSAVLRKKSISSQAVCHCCDSNNPLKRIRHGSIFFLYPLHLLILPKYFRNPLLLLPYSILRGMIDSDS